MKIVICPRLNFCKDSIKHRRSKVAVRFQTLTLWLYLLFPLHISLHSKVDPSNECFMGKQVSYLEEALDGRGGKSVNERCTQLPTGPLRGDWEWVMWKGGGGRGCSKRLQKKKKPHKQTTLVARSETEDKEDQLVADRGIFRLQRRDCDRSCSKVLDVSLAALPRSVVARRLTTASSCSSISATSESQRSSCH